MDFLPTTPHQLNCSPPLYWRWRGMRLRRPMSRLPISTVDPSARLPQPECNGNNLHAILPLADIARGKERSETVRVIGSWNGLSEGKSTVENSQKAETG